uniref:SUEL-type lectin domain-containing protein n=1 Tax=Sander lucioperca TaxID=283035 RepID=A0A8C9X9N6_SANLU
SSPRLSSLLGPRLPAPSLSSSPVVSQFSLSSPAAPCPSLCSHSPLPAPFLEPLEALYGRADSVTCGEGKPQEQLANTECSLEGTMDILKSVVRSRYLHVCVCCIIKASNSVFGGPCPGTFKYLEVAYVCLS